MKCLSAPHYHHLQGRGRGKDEIEVSHMANDLVSHAYTMESHIKILEWWGSGSFWFGERLAVWEGGHLYSMEEERKVWNLCTSLPPYFALLAQMAKWLFPSYILYNKTVITSMELSSVVWVVNYWTWGSGGWCGHGTLRVCSLHGRSAGSLGILETWGWHWSGTEPLTCGVCTKLNRRTPSWCRRIVVRTRILGLLWWSSG